MHEAVSQVLILAWDVRIQVCITLWNNESAV